LSLRSWSVDTVMVCMLFLFFAVGALVGRESCLGNQRDPIAACCHLAIPARVAGLSFSKLPKNEISSPLGSSMAWQVPANDSTAIPVFAFCDPLMHV
jgi:hypothetical protein